jgi:hypothetical protein
MTTRVSKSVTRQKQVQITSAGRGHGARNRELQLLWSILVRRHFSYDT